VPKITELPPWLDAGCRRGSGHEHCQKALADLVVSTTGPLDAAIAGCFRGISGCDQAPAQFAAERVPPDSIERILANAVRGPSAGFAEG
jgi:hypothetical protein